MAISFTYNSFPKNNIKKYGLKQQLISTVTISGEDSPYIYNSTFYLSDGQQIAPTISGTVSGYEVFTDLNTISGANYSWYIETTSSGVTDRSPDYSFYVRYLCSGICNEISNPASGINVKLYKRTSGELIGSTTTAGAGTFQIDTTYNEEHYAVALHPSSGINALIYDHLTP